MEKNAYFKEALQNMTMDAASGGAIRHLTDLGYSPGQIAGMLDFPTPMERIRSTCWKHLWDLGKILDARPAIGTVRETVRYVREFDAYGKATFRRVVETSEKADGNGPGNRPGSPRIQGGAKIQGSSSQGVDWREVSFADPVIGIRLHTEANRKTGIYASVSFGLLLARDPEGFAQQISILAKEDRQYLKELPWERKLLYVRLDERMMRIVLALLKAGHYHGEICLADEGLIYRK